MKAQHQPKARFVFTKTSVQPKDGPATGKFDPFSVGMPPVPQVGR